MSMSKRSVQISHQPYGVTEAPVKEQQWRGSER